VPSLEDMWREDEVAASFRRAQEVATLRLHLSTALEMLQVMQEELLEAHDALSAMPPPAVPRCSRS